MQSGLVVYEISNSNGHTVATVIDSSDFQQDIYNTPVSWIVMERGWLPGKTDEGYATIKVIIKGEDAYHLIPTIYKEFPNTIVIN